MRLGWLTYLVELPAKLQPSEQHDLQPLPQSGALLQLRCPPHDLSRLEQAIRDAEHRLFRQADTNNRPSINPSEEVPAETATNPGVSRPSPWAKPGYAKGHALMETSDATPCLAPALPFVPATEAEQSRPPSAPQMHAYAGATLDLTPAEHAQPQARTSRRQPPGQEQYRGPHDGIAAPPAAALPHVPSYPPAFAEPPSAGDNAAAATPSSVLETGLLTGDFTAITDAPLPFANAEGQHSEKLHQAEEQRAVDDKLYLPFGLSSKPEQPSPASEEHTLSKSTEANVQAQAEFVASIAGSSATSTALAGVPTTASRTPSGTLVDESARLDRQSGLGAPFDDGDEDEEATLAFEAQTKPPASD